MRLAVSEPRWLREREPGEGPTVGLDEQQREEADDGDFGRRLLCRLCSAPVTTEGAAIEVEGRHRHTFFNPAGVLFEIGCFAQAPGCRVSGAPTAEFAWFAGTRWQFSTCASCGVHLGWSFVGQGDRFFGLILNRLVEQEEPRPDS